MRLNDTQIAVLRAAADGQLVRDETVGGRNRTRTRLGYWIHPATVTKLTKAGLIQGGPLQGVLRPWTITDAGRGLLDVLDQKET